MRPATLFFFVPALLSAQTLDGGLLNPSWFGPAARFTYSSQGYQWVRPGTSFRGRTLWIREWQPPVWLGRARDGKDHAFADRVKAELPSGLERGLQEGGAGAVGVSTTQGDVVVVGRTVDAAGEEPDAMFSGPQSLTLDLKLVDAVTGDLLAAFHQTFAGEGERAVADQYRRWCMDLGRRLAAGTSAPLPAMERQPARPVLDLAATLARLEALRRDGVLTEEGFQALVAKARAMAPGK